MSDMVTDDRPAALGKAVPLLSVVVPVYNQAAAIAENITVIREVLDATVEGDIELIVVSDGSIDRTQEQVLSARDERMRFIHYDRNLGKGYAVKVGALEARGKWIAYLDSDLDLDPGLLGQFLLRAQEADLDIAIGSKRHPRSEVHYPRSRRVASWMFQQAVRLLFRFSVRDTQVGMKLFRRDVIEQVFPFLLVKRFAFDIELLAVARSFGFKRIEEQPIRLDYRFTGSGVRSIAVLRALIDTAAVFYRLTILRYYHRKRMLTGAYGWTRPREYVPLVSVITTEPELIRTLDYPMLEFVPVEAGLSDAVRRCRGSVIAVLESGARPAGNWISATTPFLSRTEVAAVVVPQLSSHQGSIRERTAAAVRESRFGGGSMYFRHTPGNVRYLSMFHGRSFVAHRNRLLEVNTTRLDEVVDELARDGNLILYTPESVLTLAPPPLLRPHLRAVWEQALHRGRTLRRFGLRGLGVVAVARAAIVSLLAIGALPALAVGGHIGTVWLLLAAAYGVALGVSAIVAALRFRSIRVGLLAVPVMVLTHLVHFGGVARGLADERRRLDSVAAVADEGS